MKSMIAEASTAACDVPFNHGTVINFGSRSISVLATPGHTAVSIPAFILYVVYDMLYLLAATCRVVHAL